MGRGGSDSATAARLASYQELPDSGDPGLDDAILDCLDVEPSETRWLLQQVRVDSLSFDAEDFTEENWVSLSSVEQRPICVYAFEEKFVVLDGRHRSTLAAQKGETLIDAYVYQA